MSDTDGVLWALTAPELATYALAGVVLLASLLGATTLFSDIDPRLRLAGLVAVFVQLLSPLYVYADSRRRGVDAGIWLHVAALPAIGVFGVLVYLESRE